MMGRKTSAEAKRGAQMDGPPYKGPGQHRVRGPDAHRSQTMIGSMQAGLETPADGR